MKTKPKTSRESKYDLLKLDNQLCFALYAATSAISRTYRVRLGPMGITYPQYLVLVVLWEKDGVSISEIGRKLMLGTGTLTPLVKRLEKLELVTRERSKDDERLVKVWLSSKGLDLRDKALDARLFVGCSLGMTEDEIMVLRSDLIDLIERLGVDKHDEAKG